ncbi:MAG: DUF4199 domain-containing protein [Pyrinomonadaceae bacterium]
MKKTVLVFGLIAGAIMSLMLVGTVPFADRIGFDKGAIIGYTTMVLSFLLVFFGIRSYRDNVAGGSITFGKAFVIGILITIVACLCYVGTWEVVYFKFMPDFAEKFSKYAIEKVIASGASTDVVNAKIQEMKNFMVMYNNPLFNAAITFTEPLPVGLIMTLISAAILRKKRQPSEGEEKIGEPALG